MFVFQRGAQPAPRSYRLSDARVAELDDNDHLKAIIIHDKSVPFVQFDEVSNYLTKGYHYKLEVELEHFTENDNRIISLTHGNDLKLAEVQLNPLNNKIYPPK